MEQSNFYQIKNITEHEYTLVGCDGSVITRPIRDIDKSASVFTIQDAKDGDVLCCESGWTCIFKTLVNDETFSSYCFMDKTKWFCETGSECHTLDKVFIKAYNGEIHPATKEQRDALMKAMTDAGYIFDFEKKELKKIESYNLRSIIKDEPSPAIKKVVDSLTAWSEEDEIALGDALWCCKQAASIAKDENDMGNVWYAERWLKSLRPQTRWKPSDEQIIELRHVISGCSYDIEPLVELETKLKEL